MCIRCCKKAQQEVISESNRLKMLRTNILMLQAHIVLLVVWKKLDNIPFHYMRLSTIKNR